MTESADYAKAASVDIAAIPVIDLNHRHDPEGKLAIGQTLFKAAKEVGFFYLKGHGISPEIQASAFVASRKFFALADDDKASVAVDQNQRGWMPAGLTNLEGAKTHDQKEVFFWGYELNPDDPDLKAKMPMLAMNRWPHERAAFLKPALMPYYQAVLDLSRDVLSALALGMGMPEDTFATAYQKPLGRGQLVYYPAMDEEDYSAQRFGAAAHTDFGVLTILMQDALGGLQIATQDGGWIEAPPIADSFVCNIGDLLEMWTGGILKSTLHRVINRSAQARYSIPIFCDPSSDTIIDPKLFESLDGQVASPESPITAGKYIMQKNKKNFAHYRQ